MLSGRDLALQSYKKKQQQEFSDALPMPDMGTANSTAQVTEIGFNPFVDIPKMVVQGTARGAFATGMVAGGALLGMSPEEINKVRFKPESGAKVWLGEEEVGLASEGTDILTSFGVPEKMAVNTAPFLVVGLTALDLTTGGGGKGNFVKRFAKMTNEAEIAKDLKAFRFSDETVTEFAPQFAKTTDEKEIAKLFADAAKAESVFTTELRVADGADVVTPGGQVFSDAVSSVRNRLESIFKKTDEAELGGTKAVVERAIKADSPTIKDLRLATDALEVAGAKVDDIVKDLSDITATVKIDPERFGTDVVKAELKQPTEYVRGGKIPTEGDGPVYLTAATEDGENYARGYTLKESVKTGEIGNIARAKLDEDVKIFDVRKKEDIESLRTVNPEAAAELEASVRAGNVDWQIANKHVESVKEAGFDGMRMREREAGAPVFDAAGKQTKAVKDIESVAVFDKRKIEWTDSKKALEEVANPVKEKLGMLAVHVQDRYGKAVVTKSKAEKFAKEENKVFHEIYRYAEEAAYVAENGGEMVQKMPSWVPEDLRDVVTFQHVTQGLQRGELPASHASKEMALYTAMVDETARRAGIKTAPKGAVNPEGALLESMRNRTRTPGSKTNPLVKGQVDGIDETAALADDSIYVADYHSQEEALAAYNKYEAEKYSAPRSPRNRGGQVNEKTPYGLNMATLKDVTKFKAGFRDIYRNSERFFGEQWPIVKQKFFDPFDAAKGRMVDEEKKLLDALEANVVGKYGIKKGSKESAAVMDFGEREIDYDELVKRFGAEKAENIKDAALWFRGEYDRMIDELNVIEARIYPNNPQKITPKRRDYFRHYEEMSEGWSGFKNAFEDPTLSNLPPGLKTEDSKGAKSKWQSFKQERLGWRSKRDAVGGFLNYVPNYVYSKHIDPQTATFRNFTRDLRTAVGEGESPIQNYIEGLESWTDDLAGQANVMDRFAERFVPGGRKAINVLDFMNKRAKRNAILGNVGASVSQAFNVPGAIASAGPIHSTRGFARSIGDIIGYGDRPVAWSDSPFIKERYRHSEYDRFNVGMLEHTKEFASWMLGVLDEVGTKFAWNAHYEKALRNGVADPVKFADEYTRKAVAGRGVGEVPIVQKSKTFQMIAPFQLEVMNQWYLMREFLDEKSFGKFATLFVAYSIFNEGAEEIKGMKVGFDPLGAIYESYQIAVDDSVDEDGTPVTPTEKAKKIAGRLGGEVLSNIPLGSYATTGIATIAGMSEEERKDFFGKADPVRFGQAPLLWNAVKDPLFGLLPNWGGAQIEKSLNGIRAVAEGKVRDKDGKVFADTKPGVVGALQSVLFGGGPIAFEYKQGVEAEMKALFIENMRLKLEGNVDAVKANLQDLPENVQSIYVDVAKKEIAAERNRQKVAMRPTYDIISALVREGKTTEAKKISDAMTPKEKELYAELHKDIKDAGGKPGWVTEKTQALQTTLDYAYAFGTNPVQAFEIVFKNHEIIEDTVGGSFSGVVRTRRIEYKDTEDGEDGSDTIKKRMMAEQGIDKKQIGNYALEHIIPLGIGGSNQMDNLDLVPKDEHDAWTPVEVYLVNAVKNKEIDYKEAQDLIRRHKGYGGDPITFEEIKAIVSNK